MSTLTEVLNAVREVTAQLDLPPDLFDHTSIQELERYRQRVAVEASFELRRHPEPMRLMHGFNDNATAARLRVVDLLARQVGI
jgi:hypothetical protein